MTADFPAPAANATSRFSSRVDNYIRYRPGYPPEIYGLLRENAGMQPASVLADIGSGTGILTELFLRAGHTVFGVEPNPEMRAAGERLLAGYPQFRSGHGTAEATGLPDASVDLITAAQAFHWFDQPKARTEFARILRPGGHVALIWNERLTEATPFLRAYEDFLLEFGTDYKEVNHTRIDEAAVQRFFLPGGCRRLTLPNAQHFDFAGLKGRLLSSSYTPEPTHPQYPPMLAALAVLFEKHAQSGQISFLYETLIYTGQLREG